MRRPHIEEDNPFVQAFRHHLTAEDGFFILGNILQELLDGLRSPKQFQRLIRCMEPFPLLTLSRASYVEAASLKTLCREKGIQGSPVDFLIASACIEHGFPLLTADKDFLSISKHSALIVLPPLE